jgi:hypothetical protein
VVRTVRAARLSIVAAKAKAIIMRISARPAAVVRFEILQFDHQRFHVAVLRVRNPGGTS